MHKVIIVLIFLLIPSYSFAYLGPGMGGGIIAVTIGIIVAIFAAIFGILWFPIKRLINKKKNKVLEVKKEEKE